MNNFVFLILFLILVFLTTHDKIISNKDKQNIKILSRQAARWSVAAQQDKNPLIAVLHANYGAGFLWALTDLYYPNEISQATGIDYNVFKKQITKIQDISVKKLAAICPNYAPKYSYLAKIAGEG